MLQVPDNDDSDDEATMAAPQRRMPFGGMIHNAARNVLLNKMTVKKQDAPQPSVAQNDEPIQYAKAVANEKSNLDELDDLLGSLGSDSSSGCNTHSEDLDL